ncbi:MAG: Lrp/AsnC family transcriptional regulator [archaeon]|nr:Lrp/AsnC family transcriptional regulator [archaeon]
MENSRLTYRELADMVDMNVSSVHKRINNLVEDKVILGYIARPSAIALKYLAIMIFGTSKARSVDAVSAEIGQQENINFIGIAGAKHLSISAYLRDISELQEISTYVSKTAQMSEPIVGIINVPYITTPEPLTTIDFKILKSLNRDARKPMTDIADDVGLSTKTVRKRLDRMIENNLVDFTIMWSEKAATNLTTAFHIYLKEGADINSTIKQFYERYSQNIIACLSYSNIPNFITVFMWTQSTQESQEIQEKLQSEGFKDIIPYIALSSDHYECWIDQLLRTK